MFGNLLRNQIKWIIILATWVQKSNSPLSDHNNIFNLFLPLEEIWCNSLAISPCWKEALFWSDVIAASLHVAYSWCNCESHSNPGSIDFMSQSLQSAGLWKSPAFQIYIKIYARDSDMFELLSSVLYLQLNVWRIIISYHLML